MFNQNQLHVVEETTPPTPTTPPAEPTFDTVEPAVTPPPAENADIYYMPDTFRKNNAVAGKRTNIPGVWVLIVSVVLLVCLGGGLILYWVHPSFLNGILGGEAPAPVPLPEGLLDTTQPTTPLPTDEQTLQRGSAKETYLAFQTELAGATTSETYLSVYAKYGTKILYDELIAEKERLENAGLSSTVLESLRAKGSPVLDGTEDITETSSETESTLTITTTNQRQTGTVVFTLEEGVWKISKESWKSDEPTTPSGEIQAGTDSDEDGLTDKEEEVLGTNVNGQDSDGDGYKDLAEVNNSYNPTGAGKLSDDKKLGTYANTTFNVSVLYPVAWQQTVASSDDSIIFTAPDGQFIQVLVQPNSDREDIVSWYKKTFDVENIPTTQLVTNPNWDGVRTPDGLTAYLTNKDKSYIFVVTYNLGNSRVLNYKNILELMLRSLHFTV